MHSFLYPFYVAGFAVAALAVLILGFVAPVRRANGLEKTARELNFKFSAFGTPFENTDVSGIAILENGPATVVANLLERTTGDCQFLICDVENCALEDATTTLVTTVAAFRMRGVHLPIFQIGERNVIGRVVEQIEHAFGKELDEFDTPDVPRNLFVHCSAKGEVRNFLTPAKFAYLREHASHFRVESSSDWLWIYRVGVKVDAEHIKEFSEITSALASALLTVQLPNAA